jgi:hypothetical protein
MDIKDISVKQDKNPVKDRTTQVSAEEFNSIVDTVKNAVVNKLGTTSRNDELYITHKLAGGTDVLETLIPKATATNPGIMSKEDKDKLEKLSPTALNEVKELVGDRAATSERMGYVILDSNKTFAEQVTQENTIYEIRDAFDLGGSSTPFTIKEGCVLKFEGGKLSNGIIKGNNSVVESNTSVVFHDCIIQGSWNIPVVCQGWFNFSGEEGFDNSANFKNMLAMTSANMHNDVFFNGGRWCTNTAELAVMEVKSNTSLFMGDCTIVVNPHASNHKNVILIQDASQVDIHGGHIIGDAEEHDYATDTTTAEHNHGIKIVTNCHHVSIDGTVVEKMTGDGIDMVDDYGDIEHIIITNVTLDGNNRQALSIESGKNIEVRDSLLINTSKYHVTAPSAGIDIEPWIESAYVKDVLIENCEIKGNVGESLLIQPNYKKANKTEFVNNIVVRNCSIDGRVAIRDCNTCTIESVSNSGNTADNISNTKNVIVKGVNFDRLEIYDSDNLSMEECNVAGYINTDYNRPVSNAVLKNTNCGGAFRLQSSSATIEGCSLSTFEISNGTATVCRCDIASLAEYPGANCIYKDNHITMKPEGMTDIRSKKFYGNTIVMYAMRLLTSDTILEDNRFIYHPDAAAPTSANSAVWTAVDKGKFTLKRNVAYGFENVVGKNFGNEDLTIFSDQQVKQTRNNSYYMPVEGCKDVFNGKNRVYRGGDWIFDTVAMPTSGRPTAAYTGEMLFDTTLNKPIWWNGTEWLEGDNQAGGIQRVGTWSQRPNADGSYLDSGFQYFLLESEPDEDPEGNPIESLTGNGKPIWWIQDGRKWVDASGNTITDGLGL